MKKVNIVLSILLGIIFISSCEKDDICVDGATPLLSIEFYDVTDTTELKDVTTLVVQGILEDSVYPIITNVSLSAIELPLRVDATSTTFIISENLTPTDSTTVNKDTITFNYETKELFVSRACGFTANYDNLQGSINDTDADQWMEEIKIMTTLVENDTLVNVKILH
ncbi:DUF6452 family protein [uncultured Kriegella sp.]|uniref:DUF6452 family protein n=1 Tax=uncultured Kriegella sp. TaxID=1798910 RepID=UPI0030DC225A|tara:strand:- start:27288 stop:27788 length:501 start_codon:yes stop_codon:yes gene_type:complete